MKLLLTLAICAAILSGCSSSDTSRGLDSSNHIAVEFMKMGSDGIYRVPSSNPLPAPEKVTSVTLETNQPQTNLQTTNELGRTNVGQYVYIAKKSKEQEAHERKMSFIFWFVFLVVYLSSIYFLSKSELVKRFIK